MLKVLLGKAAGSVFVCTVVQRDEIPDAFSILLHSFGVQFSMSIRDPKAPHHWFQ